MASNSTEGTPMPRHRNVAARAGRWSATHRKQAILGWLVLVVLCFGIGGAVGTQNLKPEQQGVGESGAAGKATFAAFPKKVGEQVLVQSKDGHVGDPAFRAAVRDVQGRLQATKGVRDVVGPYGPAAATQVSPDRRSALVSFEVKGDSDKAEGPVVAAVKTVDAAAKAHPALSIGQFGDVSAEKAIAKASAKDLQKAEFLSLPLTLIILVLAFGTLVAAGLPLLLAISAVIGTMGLVGPISHITPVSPAIMNVILLIGLAVGVDYALFYIRREREERAAGRGPDAALEAAAATSGRAVLISGFTVMIAMAGMYFAGNSMFTSFATGTIAVVGMAMLGSLTVLPAVMSKLGDRIEKGRLPLVGGLKRRAARFGLWSRVIDRVLKRPLVSALAAGALLVALAIPALGMHTEVPGVESLPRDVKAVQTYDKIQAAFPAEKVPSVLVLKARDVTAPAVTAGVDRLKAAVAKRPDLFERAPADIEMSPDKTVAMIGFPARGDGSDVTSQRVLDVMRDDLVPASIGGVPGVQHWVTGQTAGNRDFNDSLASHLPLVFGFVLGAAFLLLLVTFRSLVVPIKAILLNVLSVGAAYGVLVLVFQKGWGEGLLGFESTGAIAAWIPLFLFVILFGLSMDYHVFILTRVREAFDRGMSSDEAVAHGIKSTAGVVTSAAAVMVGVFATFATLGTLELKEMGLGLAVAVLLDATVIRGVLLPATMKMLGERNWWLPKRLTWLPKVAPEREAPAPSAG
jgi:uncharacterized membrane protein YdfJ with MMPL/SSD domain